MRNFNHSFLSALFAYKSKKPSLVLAPHARSFSFTEFYKTKQKK